jgi:hypothetical protein
MARRPVLIKIKQKAQKKSKTEQYLINRKYCGDEPTFTSKEVTPTQHHTNLSWYNYMSDIREAREYLIEYLKNTGRDSEARRVKDVPDKWLPTTACWIARMRSRGANFPESTKEFFEDRLKTALQRDYTKSDKMEAESAEGESRPKVERSVQDRMTVILDSFICDIEEKIDEFITTWKPGFEMYAWLQGREVPTVQAKRMLEYYNPQLEEIETAFNGDREGYEGYTKEQLTKLYGFHVMIVEDLEQYCMNGKKVRKPRTKKPMTAEKKLKDFKYQKFENMYKLQSVQPEKILGAVELWTFSTKYNQLTVFRSSDPAGLDVHRTSITNFDPIHSHTKKLRAKDVESVLKELQGAGKVVLRTLMQNARGSDQKLQERMNENTILLRVVTK